MVLVSSNSVRRLALKKGSHVASRMDYYFEFCARRRPDSFESRYWAALVWNESVNRTWSWDIITAKLWPCFAFSRISLLYSLSSSSLSFILDTFRLSQRAALSGSRGKSGENLPRPPRVCLWLAFRIELLPTPVRRYCHWTFHKLLLA